VKTGVSDSRFLTLLGACLWALGESQSIELGGQHGPVTAEVRATRVIRTQTVVRPSLIAASSRLPSSR
jgi:hypothetical protein